MDFYNLAITFKDKIIITHYSAQILNSLSKIGSYLSIILSIWGLFTIFLKKKYKNKQAKMIQNYEYLKLHPNESHIEDD